MNDLSLICETCRFPISGDSGCIYTTFAEMRTSSDEIRWRTSHYAHFTEGIRDTYEIGSEQIATWPRLAWWTAHLMEKNWFPLSDWDDLLREVAGEFPSRRIRVAAKEAGMIAYEPYDDTECPRCGNTEGNFDHGPYEPHPSDAELGGPSDPSVHLMSCGGCRKPFDVAPQELVDAAMPELAADYPDACPSPDCRLGNVPVRVYEKRGRHLAEYRCPRGYMWVTRWGHRNLSDAPLKWPIERQIVDVFPSEHDTTIAVDVLEALVGGTE